MSAEVDKLYMEETDKQFPPYVLYVVTNVCNAKCTFCPQSEIADDPNFSKQHLSWEHFTRSVEEIAKHPIKLLRFTSEGEPMMHPKMPEMIAYAKKVGIQKVDLTSNGSLLKGKRLKQLMECPPDIMDVSLDAFHQETFEKYRVGLDFDEVKKNVMHLLEIRDPAKTKVMVSMIHHEGLDEEVELFRNYWEGRVDNVAIRRPHTNLGTVDVGDKLEKPDDRWPCPHIWQRLLINHAGNIRFCPVDWHEGSNIGSLDEMTVAEAWQGPLMTDLRQRHVEGNFCGSGVCENCPDWPAIVWGHGWLNLVDKNSKAS
ncbi:MAG: radical SAM protein [Magnetovibrio sp.]|nr:radical SAM protein [Magnetovibrio sp.]